MGGEEPEGKKAIFFRPEGIFENPKAVEVLRAIAPVLIGDRSLD